MLVARQAREEELRFRAVSVVDGTPIKIEGLAEALMAARRRFDPAEGTAGAVEERRTECLAERLRQARERVANWPDQDNIR